MTPRRPQGRLPVNLHPGRIAIGYIVVGLVWIYGSGFALRLPIFNGFTEAIEIFKGTGYVLVTAAGLYVVLARRSRAIDTAQRELIAVDEQRARLVAAVEQSEEAVVITDLSGTITYVNPAFQRVSGYTERELLGGTPNIVRSGQHEPEFYAQLWAALLRGETWQGRFINRNKEGATYEADSVITPVRDARGVVVAYAGLQHDTTRERTLERYLAEAGRLEAVGQLAGGIAHDFNNLLMIVLGHAELLSASDSLDDSACEDVQQIAHASQSAAALVRQLLAFSRRQVLEPAVVDLQLLVGQLRPMIAGLLGSAITLEVKSGTAPSAVLVDAGQLEQVIVNLAVNARDAMPTGGTFTMSVSNVNIGPTDDRPEPVRPGSYSVLTASDTGSGMDAATRNRVFEPFFTTKPQGRGTGLGLATAHGIVSQSGGFLFVDSELGRGSTFTVYLPHHDGTPAPRSDNSPDPMPRGTESILLVEDEKPVRAVIERALRQLGYTVLVAHDGEEAARLADDNHPSLLIADVRLPGIDGPSLAAQIAGNHPDLAVLFVSGYASEAMIENGSLGTEAAFLAKPFTSDDLGRQVRALLDRPRTSKTDLSTSD